MSHVIALGEGIGEFFHQAQEYHDKRLGVDGSGMDAYVGRKVRSKQRRFNSADNRENHTGDAQAVSDKAIIYKRESGGE